MIQAVTYRGEGVSVLGLVNIKLPCPVGSLWSRLFPGFPLLLGTAAVFLVGPQGKTCAVISLVCRVVWVHLFFYQEGTSGSGVSVHTELFSTEIITESSFCCSPSNVGYFQKAQTQAFFPYFKWTHRVCKEQPEFHR